MRRRRKTKILATLGPASSSPEKIKAFLQELDQDAVLKPLGHAGREKVFRIRRRKRGSGSCHSSLFGFRAAFYRLPHFVLVCRQVEDTDAHGVVDGVHDRRCGWDRG